MSWKEKLQSRKFILAVVANLTGLAVLIFPTYTSEIVKASAYVSALLLMGLTTAGYIKGEAAIDAARVPFQPITQEPDDRPYTSPAGIELRAALAATLIIGALMVSGCKAINTATIDADGVRTTAQPASLATMDNEGRQQASFQGVAPTQLKQDAEGNWLTTPGQGGIITFPTAAGPVYLWSPKDGRIEGLVYTPNPAVGQPAVSAELVELNLSSVASVYAGQFAAAMDAIKDMTRAEAEAQVKQMEQARLITSDIAELLIKTVVPLLPMP